MTTSAGSSYIRVAVAATIVIGLLAGNFAVPRAAGVPHRARVSQGLEAELAAGAPGVFKVLIEAPQSEVDRIAETYGVTVDKRLAMGAVLGGTSAQFNAIANDLNVAALNADEIVTSTMAVTTQSTGTSTLWRVEGSAGNFSGLTGAGIGVAVIDSGVDHTHPDLSGRVTASLDFTGNAVTGIADAYGHGSHVGGIIAGHGTGSRTAAGSAYVGMAPGAEIISLRVLEADGTGYASDVIRAIEWAVKNRSKFKIRVINLSLGHAPSSSHGDDPMAQAVERAVKTGIVVVASAGNRGKAADGTLLVGAINSPGFTPGALTVGALNTRGTVARSDDGVASYSSRGPVGEEGDESTWELKPDLVAPGNAIVATGIQGSALWENFPERQVAGTTGGTYLMLSGASMATAVTSGAVAQLLQAEPDLTPAQVKFALQFTAEKLEGFGLIEQGAGSLNVPLAVALTRSDAPGVAPISNEIAGETIEAGHFAFAGNRVSSDTIIWGNRGRDPVGGDTIIWGNRGRDPVGGDTIIWGNRGRDPVGGDTIIWGNRGRDPVGGDTIIWGNRGRDPVGGDTIIWGNRGRDPVGGDTIIWGNRGRDPVGGDTIIWGNRGRDPVGGDTIIWGNRGRDPVGGDTIIWGNRGRDPVGGDTIIWGNRGRDPVGGDTIIWGNRGRDPVGGDTIIWGNRGRDPVGGDTIIWGNRGRDPVGGDTIIWGNRGRDPVGGDTIIWGNRGRDPVGGDTIIWGNRGRDPVGGDTIIWGNRGRDPVGGDTIIWGNRGRDPVGGDTIIWGNRGRDPVGGDTIFAGTRK